MFARPWKCMSVIGLLSLLQGCAHVFVDSDGSMNVVGLVWLKLPPADSSAAQALRARSVGLSLTRSEAGSALVLGYSDSTVGFVRNNSTATASDLMLTLADKPDKEKRHADRPPSEASAGR